MKKFVSILITLSMILTPCLAYAGTASGSAISLDDHLKIMAAGGVDPVEVASVKAAAASSDTIVAPSGYAVQPYYYNGTLTGSIPYTTLSTSSSSWNGLINGISYSIAYSLRSLGSNISSGDSNIVTAVDQVFNQLVNLRGYIDNLEDYTDGIEGGLTSLVNSVGTTLGSNISTISSRVNTTNTRLSTTNSTLSDILTAIESQTFTVPQELIDDVDSINTTTSTDSSRWVWNSTFNTSSTLPRYRQNGEGGTGSDLTLNPTSRSLPNQIWFWLSTMNTSMVYAFRDLTSGVGTVNSQTYLDKDLNPISMGRTSFWRDFRNIGGNINDIVARLGFVLASDDEIEARQAASANTAAVVDEFIKPTGSAHASVSDFGSVADLAAAGSDNLSSGVAPSVLLDQLGGDGDGWGWFSQQIQNELSAPSGRSDLRSDSKSSGSDTPYLDAYYADLQEKIGVKLW